MNNSLLGFHIIPLVFCFLISSCDVEDDSVDDSDSDLDSDSDSEDSESELTECENSVHWLAEDLYADFGSCTFVVRLDHQTFEMLGYQIFCGEYNYVTQSEAYQQAVEDTGWAGGELNPDNPKDEYVFLYPPGDFGGCAVVSARTGLSLFGGGIIWMGTGEITYPEEWRSPKELGSGCPSFDPVPYSAYDLTGYNWFYFDPRRLGLIYRIIDDTAIFGALSHEGKALDMVIVRYPRTVGAFIPDHAEWIVFVNGGWGK